MANHAASFGVMLSKVEVIAAYPITPQTQIVELLSVMCADGQIQAKFLKVESEHSAMACCIGAATTGARTFTATSSQGLLLMHELLHWASGARLPIVMTDVNRGISAPWTIWTDQTDSLSQRDTGWIQFYCESNQEVLDTVIQAYKISEKVLLPSMVVYDGFYLSHTSEPVDIPSQEEVNNFLPKFQMEYKLDVNDPLAFNSVTFPEHYMELRYQLKEAMEGVPKVVNETGREFKKTFGREYDVIECYMVQDAEVILLASSTVASTAKVVIDSMREKGEKVGLIRIRMFNPFPKDRIVETFRGVPKVAVLDRNYAPGIGGIFAQVLRSALMGEKDMPTVFGFVTGLGGRDVTPGIIEDIIIHALKTKAPKEDSLWIGLKS